MGEGMERQSPAADGAGGGIDRRAAEAAAGLPFSGMAGVSRGRFRLGSGHHHSEEAPAQEVRVDGFWMDTHPVTNEEFRRFVEATGHVTLAERAPDPADYPGAKPEMLVPASVVFQKPKRRVGLGDHYNWWGYVAG